MQTETTGSSVLGICPLAVISKQQQLSDQRDGTDLLPFVVAIVFSRVFDMIGIGSLRADFSLIGSVPIAVAAFVLVYLLTFSVEDCHLDSLHAMSGDREVIVVLAGGAEDIRSPEEIPIEIEHD